ncbi:MAG: xanthine dehydrogenase family protein molybdopterin-binding subunit, partial [Hyphomicrobiaceae bacterium]
MAKIATIARRTFLIGSALVAGGVAFGVYEAKKAIPNPLLDDIDEGEAAITPFVKIDSTGVTLITPRADKGQGTYSMQAYLIAEELDIDPHNCKLDPGEPNKAYYNGVATADNAPFPAYDHGWIPDHLRSILSSVGKIIAFQITGGSTSIADMHERLLTAGAVARETLKEAAARRWKVDRSSLKTEDGKVIGPDGKTLAYTELAKDAANITPVADVALRDPKGWRYLGKKVQRTDIVAKSTGTQIFGIDAKVDGMVHATVRANPGLGGDVKKFDASKAEKMRGVKKVLPIKHGVAVVADNTWRAIQAANAIEIEWGPGPYPADTGKMWDALKSSATDEFLDKRWRDDGDVD